MVKKKAKEFKIEFDKELIEYLKTKPPEYFEEKIKYFQDMKDKCNYYLKNYESVSIDEWVKEIQPKEDIRDFYENMYFSFLNSIETGKHSCTEVISFIENLALLFNTPSIPHNKNNDKNKFHYDYLENIKSRIISICTNDINPPAKGFQSKLTDTQIESLHNQMKGTYIDETPSLDNFKAIFKDEPLPQGFIKVKRKKPFTAVLCAYFVNKLFQKENPKDFWNIANNCFIPKINRQSLTNAKNYNPDDKPRGYKEIDTIIQNIYKPLL